MASHAHHQTVKVRTIDGIDLETWVYPVNGSAPAPAIIMTPGLNCIKEMTLPETAEGFQSAGYNVLLYDPRSVGGSGGIPKNQIDPQQMIEDVSDIVSYAARLPSVDHRRIMLWGISLGATVSACAAAVDRRVAAVLMVCPIFTFIRPDKRAKVFAQLMRDRVSQLRGNEAFVVQPVNSKGENGFPRPGGEEAFLLMMAAAERAHPNFRNRITLQSFHKIALFRPKEVIEQMLEGIPTMMMIPELDEISLPAEQKEVYDKLNTPKKLHLAEGKTHLTILTGEGSDKFLHAQIEFFETALKGEIE